MKIEVLKKSLFANNEKAAEENRRLLRSHDVLAVNVMGGAGCGKTTLLECVIPLLSREIGVAVLEGDLATTRDAARIAALRVPVIQLLTEGGCHLTATLVQAVAQEAAAPKIEVKIDGEDGAWFPPEV